jgi:hypothetical protein
MISKWIYNSERSRWSDPEKLYGSLFLKKIEKLISH